MKRFSKFIACMAITAIAVAGFAGCGSADNAAQVTNEVQTEVVETEENTEEKAVEEVAEASLEEAAEETSGKDASDGTRTIVDHTGAEVVLPEKIERVVISSILPLPSVFCQFRGSADEIIAIHPSSMAAAKNSYLVKAYPNIADADTSFVENGEVNIEQLLTLNPDVVFYSAANTEERALYDNAGIPAVGFSTFLSDYDSVETYADWISLLGEIYGEQETANAIIEEGRQVAKDIKAVTDNIPEEEKPKVLILFQYSDGVINTSGSKMFGQYWITTAGGINVAEELEGTPEINMEQIYEWDPDIILITNFSPMLPEDLYNNTIEGHDWSIVKAVKEGHVYKFPLGMYRWFPPASDTPLVLQWLAKTIQPEYFEDLDVDRQVKDFYQKYYNVTLSDDDLQDIYNPAREASGVMPK